MATTKSSTPSALVPALMRAEKAAAYVDEKSVRAFRRRVGTVYSLPIKVPGRGDIWLREDLDRDVARLGGAPTQFGTQQTYYETRRLAKIHDRKAPQERRNGLLLESSCA